MPDEVAEKLDALVREDIVVGGEVKKLARSRDMRLQYYAQVMREENEPFEKQLAPLKKKREELRREIFELWAKHHNGEVTIKLPSATVSRRNYRGIKVRDKEALIDALDRADRLDLVDYTFKETEVMHLVVDEKLPGLPEGTVKITDKYNLRVLPRKEKQ